MNEQMLLILLSVAFALTTIGLFLGGVLSFIRARAFLNGTARTNGVVIENAVAKGSDFDAAAFITAAVLYYAAGH